MHYEKFHRADVVKILQHNTRGIDSPDTHKHSNESIDKSRTHLNYDLKDRGGLSAYQYQQKLIDKIENETKARGGKALRKDAVTLCGWVVTVPETLPKEKYEDFFKGVYSFFANRYGEENIVSAVVHRDETRDHIHLCSVPIVQDKKKGFEKLCAKDLETQRTLARVHGDLQKYLEKELGCAVDILNGATVNGNKSVAELKLETTLKKVSESEKKLAEVNEKISEADKSLDEKVKTESERVKVEVETVRDEKLFEKATGVTALLEKATGTKKLTADEQARLENVSANLNGIISVYEKKISEIDERVEERAEVLCQKRMSADRKWYSDTITKQKNTIEQQMKQIQQLQQQLALLQGEQQRLSEYREFYSGLEACLSVYAEMKEIFRETGLYDEFKKLGDCQEREEEINYNI